MNALATITTLFLFALLGILYLLTLRLKLVKSALKSSDEQLVLHIDRFNDLLKKYDAEKRKSEYLEHRINEYYEPTIRRLKINSTENISFTAKLNK